MRALYTGNQAIARGAWEAGVKVATAYPGTPSTEILESLAAFPEVRAEWSPNEKVALEVALGAALAGVRSIVAFKHVGLNVASDPLLTASYIGVTAGLVVVTADDPGMFSSQNEQDNRHYGRLGKVPVLEPSSSQEALDFTRAAFDLSERFDTPVLVRTTSRVSHTRCPVELGERREPGRTPGWVKDPAKMVMVPSHARARHPLVEERLRRLEELAEECPWNRVEMRDPGLGIVTGGIAYQYVREALPQASVLKLGLAWPLPRRLILDFARRVGRLLVVEELDPFWETEVRALGLDASGKAFFPAVGELSPELVACGAETALGERSAARPAAPAPAAELAVAASGPAGGGTPAAHAPPSPALPGRPPVLCPGCPHRPMFYVLHRLGVTVTGDIGCYTLAVLPPLQSIDTCTCMGASIGQAMGIELALGREASRRTVAVIGDSTFVHSGITGLIEVVYNRGAVTVIILDNGTTAMTGHQPHPATGVTAEGQRTHRLDLEGLCRAVGVEKVEVVDPCDLEAARQAVSSALAHEGPAVVISRRPCVLLDRGARREPMSVDPVCCTGCGSCWELGCPALEPGEITRIDAGRCTGCGVCAQVCPMEAIGGGGNGSGR
ncbi:MAG: indolepyruvate ferredoxin oxidoreductase subunit alpha [Acetobacteraceae bacterium]|nr:indolepyruvate ferredoxin oxidoreductase subunit alpha [Acetobacteraceae bacterium]